MHDLRTSPRRGKGAMLQQALLLLTVLGLAGCASIGPGTVTRDRFDYTAAVAESWQSQMLLNLVKLRYGDTPVFLDVGQIISGYSLEGILSAGGTIFNTHGVVPGVPDSSVVLGAQGKYTDRPTVTYTLLVGERFARSLMTPLPPPAILSRSILEILVDLASLISVPEAHVLERRVRPTHEDEGDPAGPLPPLIRIGNTVERPADAFAAVRYRGHWFAIDDHDMPSKRLFTFLMFLFTLVETGGKEGAPIVTISAQ
jgi:hypothetical protein